MKNFLAWFFSIIFLLGGFGNLFVSPLYGYGLIFIFIGILINPAITQYFKNKFNIVLKTSVKAIIITILLFISPIVLAATVNNNELTTYNNDSLSTPIRNNVKNTIAPKAIKKPAPTLSPTQIKVKAEKAKQAKLAAEKAKKIAEEKKRLEDRQKNIDKQFSAWDGSHRELVNFVKEYMNDPDSFDHAETYYVDHKTYLTVTMEFRGTNAFGGKILSYVEARIDLNNDGTAKKITILNNF
jgi:hypothetical protein